MSDRDTPIAIQYDSRIGASPDEIESKKIRVKEPARVMVVVPQGVNPRDIATQLFNIIDLVRAE